MIKDLTNIALIAAIWLLLILIVNPVGEFTHEDDFAYARPVKTLVETGNMHLTDWSSMTLVGHIWIGWLVSSIFGFSFTALRITELFFSFIGLLGIYFLAKEFFRSRLKQFAAVLLLAVSPQFFFYSFVFMTDITFFAFFVWSIYFFIRFLKNENKANYIIAVLLAIYTLLIRELALVLPIAFLFAGLYKYGIKTKKLFILILPLIILLIEYFAYRYWLVNIHLLTKNMDFARDRMFGMLTEPLLLIKTVTKNFVFASMYLGLYLAPLAIPSVFIMLKSISQRTRIIIYATATLMTTASLLLILFSGKAFSIVQFVLTMHHLTFWYVLPDVHNAAMQTEVVFARLIYAILGAIAVAGALSIWINLIARLYEKYKNGKLLSMDRQRGAREFLVMVFLFYFALIMTQIFFPRYQIQTVGILAIILLMTKGFEFTANKIALAFAGIFLFFFAYSSVSATHDMMEYSRVRMEALNYLNNKLKIPPAKIDGGFEYNSWHFFDWDYKPQGKNRWWVQDDEYVVVWSKINKNYKLIKEYEYVRYIPLCKKGKVYIYKRKEK